jgi:hypothetical protein
MAEKFCQTHQVVEGWVIVDLQTGANTGDWVSLKNYHNCAIKFHSAVGTAADDPTLTVQQASDVSGTGAKALNFTVIYRKQAATSLASTGTYTRTTQTAANTYTNATSAEQDLIWIVDFDASELDVDGGFDCLRATVADVGGNAQLGYLEYILYNPRDPQATLPSAIAD